VALTVTIRSSSGFHYTLQVKKAPYLTENDPKRSSAVLSEVRDSTSRGKDMESKSFSDASKIDFNTFSNSTGPHI
jgi:hypothetical protein